MATGDGISGTAIGAIAVGGLLVYFGIQNIDPKTGLQDLLKGKFPSPGPQSSNPTASGGFGRKSGGSIGGAAEERGGSMGGGTGGSIGGKADKFVEVVRAQLGKPYVWAAAGPNTFDCSGLVVYALRQTGMNVTRHTTWSFMVWNGAYTVQEPAPGDMVLYTGHMGVYVGNGRMIHAPAPGKNVEYSPVYRGLGGPVYRRIKF